MVGNISRPTGYAEVFPPRCKDAETLWKKLDSIRTPILRRTEDYARWTIPSIFPMHSEVATRQNTEITGPLDGIGPEAVNNLANKMITVLFPLYAPFMRLKVRDDEMAQIKLDAENGMEEAQLIMDNVEAALALAEKNAIRELNYNRYRTEATTVAKALIITGNSVLYHPEGEGNVQVYSMRDYVVRRDLNGTVIEFITRDQKDMSTLSKHVQDQLKNSRDSKYKKDECSVTLFTHIKRGHDGRYYMRQFVDKVELDSNGVWPAEELPWLILTWNRYRGEDYGRGQVEEYAGAFHGLHTLTASFVDIVGAASDLKWLVRPTSVLDVAELNNSRSGSYHMGEEGDITPVQVGKMNDLQVVADKILDWRHQIGKAFLLFSASQRDAERVTAEEMRAIINELEVQHGGIYSRFADEWQLPTAKLCLKRVKIPIGEGSEVEPQIITGLDSLSRAGDMENLRIWMQDMAMLNALPEDVRAVISIARYASFTGVRRGVDYEMIVKTVAEMQAEQEAMMQQQQQMQQNEQLAPIAAKAAMESEEG